MEILKVSSKSNPSKVAGAIANIFRENGNPGDHTGGMFEYLQVFLQSDVSAGSNLWTFE